MCVFAAGVAFALTSENHRKMLTAAAFTGLLMRGCRGAQFIQFSLICFYFVNDLITTLLPFPLLFIYLIISSFVYPVPCPSSS